MARKPEELITCFADKGVLAQAQVAMKQAAMGVRSN